VYLPVMDQANKNKPVIPPIKLIAIFLEVLRIQYEIVTRNIERPRA
jgi:hypothetical protein